MKRLINDGDIFNKYASFEKKAFRDDFVEQFNWNGHRNIAGTYKGAAYSTSLADNFMALNLRNDSNPKGSILVAAKNYTDAQIANINSAAIVQQANSYTDTKFTEAKTYTDQKVATIGGGGVHCYVIQPQDYNASEKYEFVYFTSKDIQGTQMAEANFFATALPALHPHETNAYYPEIKQKVYLERYPAQGRYHSQQVLFITITEYELYVYTWDATNNKVVANKALTWFSGGSDSQYWRINKLY